jgi:phasin
LFDSECDLIEKAKVNSCRLNLAAARDVPLFTTSCSYTMVCVDIIEKISGESRKSNRRPCYRRAQWCRAGLKLIQKADRTRSASSRDASERLGKGLSLEKGDAAVNESETKAAPNETNVFGMPLLGFPKITSPGLGFELAEQGLARAREGCEKMKVASEAMTEALRETYSSNARSTTDYGLKVLEISNTNAASAIDFFISLLGSKSVSDVFTLSASQARKTFDVVSGQNKELWVLTQKLATETGEPIRDRFAKVLHKAS